MWGHARSRLSHSWPSRGVLVWYGHHKGLTIGNGGSWDRPRFDSEPRDEECNSRTGGAWALAESNDARLRHSDQLLPHNLLFGSLAAFTPTAASSRGCWVRSHTEFPGRDGSTGELAGRKGLRNVKYYGTRTEVERRRVDGGLDAAAGGLVCAVMSRPGVQESRGWSLVCLEQGPVTFETGF